MAIKSKIINKFVLFLVAVFLMIVSITLIFEVGRSAIDISDAFTDNTYLESNELRSDMSRYHYILSRIAKELISEEEIKKASWINIEYHDLHSDAREVYDYFADEYDGDRLIDDERNDPNIMKAFIKKYPEIVASTLNIEINSRLNTYNNYLSELNKAGLEYYVKASDWTLKNTDQSKEAFEDRKFNYLFDSKGETGTSSNNMSFYRNYVFSAKDDIMYLAFTDEYISAMSKGWTTTRDDLRGFLVGLFFSVSLLLITLYQLIKKLKGDTKWIISDWYLEVILSIDFALIGLSTVFVASYNSIPTSESAMLFAVAASIVTIYMILQVSENIMVYGYRRTILYKIFTFIRSKIRNLFTKAPVMVRMLPNFKNSGDFKQALAYLEQLKDGEYHQPIEVKSHGLYSDLLVNIDTVREGLEKAVHNELKSERLKSELISNVSHDIRTPLTSIITYLDLLTKEEDREKQLDYLDVLNRKVVRLNILIEDLFDAAKISSGSIPVNLEVVNMKQLILQIIGEHNDQLLERNLEIISHIDEAEVIADRKSIWRVIDNLIINITKYALDGSRVYIDTKFVKNTCHVTFRNISEHELNIQAEELKLRFKRGDQARTSEGSGLGLAIAEDLMKLQEGKLEILIDGDLFKTTVILNMKNAIE